MELNWAVRRQLGPALAPHPFCPWRPLALGLLPEPRGRDLNLLPLKNRGLSRTHSKGELQMGGSC